MDVQNISSQLSEHDQEDVGIYLNYLASLLNEKKKNGQNWVDKNPWMKQRGDNQLVNYFILVSKDGLKFDGIEITLQSTGISYSYQAFKNKMFLSYPESVIDVSVVYQEDTFSFSKESGHVTYSHKIGSPFNQDPNKITGAYCVIKNKRGEFLTLLSRADIDKHRKVARTDYIWKAWPKEMAMKTIMKKACKQHFKDIYQNIETIDNENYDLSNLDEEEKFITPDQKIKMEGLIKSKDADTKRFLSWAGCESLDKMPANLFEKAISLLSAKVKKQ